MSGNCGYAVRWLLHVMVGLAVSIGMVYYGHSVDWTLMGMLVMYVIPLGALIWGFLNALGFAISGRLLQVRMSLRVLPLVVLSSVGGYFLFSYLDFQEGRNAGLLPQSLTSFPSYLDSQIHGTHIMTERRGVVSDSGTLGESGYLLVALQLGGLALRSAMGYALLAVEKYCLNCTRYYSKSARNTRYFRNAQEFTEAASTVKYLLERGQIVEGLTVHSRSGRADIKDREALHKVSTLIACCPICKRRQLKYSGYKRGVHNSWEEINSVALDLDLPPVRECAGRQNANLRPAATYELCQNGTVYGPLSPEQLDKMVRRGELLLTDYVRRCGSSARVTVAAALAE